MFGYSRIWAMVVCGLVMTIYGHATSLFGVQQSQQTLSVKVLGV